MPNQDSGLASPAAQGRGYSRRQRAAAQGYARRGSSVRAKKETRRTVESAGAAFVG